VAMTSVTGSRCAFAATAALGRRICGDVAGWRRAAGARQMSVAGAYRELVSAGEIRADAEQERLAGELDTVVSAVEARERVRSFAGGRLARLLSPRAAGIYIYGGVGIGKSLMMDLFFEQLRVARKRRTHFHTFMLDVHRRANLFRKTPGASRLPRQARSTCRSGGGAADGVGAMGGNAGAPRAGAAAAGPASAQG
jgi:predicted ATPase